MQVGRHESDMLIPPIQALDLRIESEHLDQHYAKFFHSALCNGLHFVQSYAQNETSLPGIFPRLVFLHALVMPNTGLKNHFTG